MTHFDLKELSPVNHEQHMRRLRKLQRLLERHDYQVNPSLVAGDMIREACSFEAARRHSD